MKDVAINEILVGVFDKFHRRKIRKTNGFEFSVNDMRKAIEFFEKEDSAVATEFEALVQIDGGVYEGYIMIWRNGMLQVRLKNE